MRFVLILSLLLASFAGGSGHSRADEKPSCLSRALKEVVDTDVGYKARWFNEAKLRKDLERAFPKSPWKREILYRIWRAEAEKGYRIYTGTDGQNDNWVLELYAVSIVRDATSGIVATARSYGLKPGHRYVVIPAKVLASIGVHHFAQNFYVVLALGGSGVIFDALGMNWSDPLTLQTDVTQLKGDEVIVLVKTDRKEEAANGNIASLADAVQMEELAAAGGGKIVLLDVSPDGGPKKEYLARVRNLADQLRRSGKTIKKMIFSAHGRPGGVHGGSFGDISLEGLASELAPLSSSLKPTSEIFFTSCFLAGNEKGREQVNRFARMMLLVGGTVHANKSLGFAGGAAHYRGMLSGNHFGMGNLGVPVMLVMPSTELASILGITAFRVLMNEYKARGAGVDRWTSFDREYQYTVPPAGPSQSQ